MTLWAIFSSSLLLIFLVLGCYLIKQNCRCYDANLVEIPVEIETPDHLYYHVSVIVNPKTVTAITLRMKKTFPNKYSSREMQLALFSSRKIEPLEELTWASFSSVDKQTPAKAFFANSFWMIYCNMSSDNKFWPSYFSGLRDRFQRN